jgi:pimeloyl-ACP methyl ester carboxylesterase
METTTVRSADGTSITVDRAGQGPALVLVMGAFCDRNAPRSLVKVLSPDFTVYSYDRRGKGDSGDTAPYAAEREIEDLAAVLELAGGRPAVFGHSSGACVALEAAEAGLPISTLVVYEAPYVVAGTRPVAADAGERLAEFLAAGDRGGAVRYFMVTCILESDEKVDAMQAGPGWPYLTGMAHTLPYEVAVCRGNGMPTRRLATIATPTLVLGGGDSPAWFQTSVRAVGEAIPGARVSLLDGQTLGVADDVLAAVLREELLPAI